MTQLGNKIFFRVGPNGEVVAPGILVICPVDKNRDYHTKNRLYLARHLFTLSYLVIEAVSVGQGNTFSSSTASAAFVIVAKLEPGHEQ